MNAFLWALVVVAGWFVVNLVGTVLNQRGGKVYFSFVTTGDVALQDRQGRSRTATSGKIRMDFPNAKYWRWLRPCFRALNVMRSQAPYVGAVMVLTLWIHNIWYTSS